MKDGYMQGDMKPEVKDYQLPDSAYAEKNMDSTLDYVSRNDKMQEKAASKLRSQNYQGKY